MLLTKSGAQKLRSLNGTNASLFLDNSSVLFDLRVAFMKLRGLRVDNLEFGARKKLPEKSGAKSAERVFKSFVSLLSPVVEEFGSAAVVSAALLVLAGVRVSVVQHATSVSANNDFVAKNSHSTGLTSDQSAVSLVKSRAFDISDKERARIFSGLNNLAETFTDSMRKRMSCNGSDSVISFLVGNVDMLKSVPEVLPGSESGFKRAPVNAFGDDVFSDFRRFESLDRFTKVQFDAAGLKEILSIVEFSLPALVGDIHFDAAKSLRSLVIASGDDLSAGLSEWSSGRLGVALGCDLSESQASVKRMLVAASLRPTYTYVVSLLAIFRHLGVVVSTDNGLNSEFSASDLMSLADLLVYMNVVGLASSYSSAGAGATSWVSEGIDYRLNQRWFDLMSADSMLKFASVMVDIFFPGYSVKSLVEAADSVGASFGKFLSADPSKKFGSNEFAVALSEETTRRLIRDANGDAYIPPMSGGWSHVGKGTLLGNAHQTVEHVVPSSALKSLKSAAGSPRAHDVGIGNIIGLPSSVNSKLKDLSVSDKLDKLRASDTSAHKAVLLEKLGLTKNFPVGVDFKKQAKFMAERDVSAMKGYLSLWSAKVRDDFVID